MASNRYDAVDKMITKLSHRGIAGKKIIVNQNYTIGICWNNCEQKKVISDLNNNIFSDCGDHFRKAEVSLTDGKIALSRDHLGIAPLYFGKTFDDELCFASEVKALSGFTRNIESLPPGNVFDGNNYHQFFHLEKKDSINEEPEVIAKNIYNRLEESISTSIKTNTIGSWLSGGLDSSTISAIARQYVDRFHTFAAGIKNAPDFEFAAAVAKHIKSDHHEIIVSLNDMVKILPKVIYHLENFDALLVRSSIINYLAAKEASNYIDEVFSGEVGDELFAGYEYLKSIPEGSLDDELIDITGSLHNTALQRVDRCSAAHGILPHVPFADPGVFEYALQIPVKYKLKNGVEKWILRKAIEKYLPEKVLTRPKAKFWEGGGVGELLAQYASKEISDKDFKNESVLPNGWCLNSKEELLYYRIFKDFFGDLSNLDWMGRTKTFHS